MDHNSGFYSCVISNCYHFRVSTLFTSIPRREKKRHCKCFFSETLCAINIIQANSKNNKFCLLLKPSSITLMPGLGPALSSGQLCITKSWECGVFFNWRLGINSYNHFRSFPSLELIHLSCMLSWWPEIHTYPRHGSPVPFLLKR